MKNIITGLAVLGLATCLSTQSNAAGFFIQEQSVSGLGSAFAGQAAMPRDASILFYNAAGMTYLEGRNGNIGINILAPVSDIDDTGTSNAGIGQPTGEDSKNPYDPTPVPNGYYTHQLNDRLWAGIGITAPFGLGSEYDENWFGRYDSIKTELKTINVQPTIAYKVNDRLSLGAGIDIQYADAELTSAVFAGAEGLSTLKGDDISYGYNLGAMYELTDQTRVGLSYRSQINHKLEGDIVVEGSGNPAVNRDVGGVANLNLPEMVNFGLAHQLNDKTTLLAGATWFGWDNFERITATQDNGTQASNVDQAYQSTWAYNIGAEYEYSPTWTFRGGVQYDETPTVDGFRTSRTPDGDRIWVSSGATYNVTERMSWDFALTYINVSEENIDLTRNTASNINGKSGGDVYIGAVGLNYKF